MQLSRRAFLLSSASLAAYLVAPGASGSEFSDFPEVLGAWRHDNSDFAGVWSAKTGPRGIKVPGRAHEVLQRPGRLNEAIAVGRRPGEFLLRFDIDQGIPIKLRMVETMRQFNGHAVFSGDGSLLYTSEHDLISGAGIIGVRDADTLEKKGELAAYGTGPHGLLLNKDGSLLVANGGVLTIPQPGSKSRGPRGDVPSLAHVSPGNGSLRGQWSLQDPELSIRHMARASDGAVGIALQAFHQSQEARDSAPVFATLDGNRLTPSPNPDGKNLGGYAGDVAFVPGDGGGYFALGCSHSDLVACWHRDGRWMGATSLSRACALVGFDRSLLAITEKGQRLRIFKPGSATSASTGLEWENHIVVLQKHIG